MSMSTSSSFSTRSTVLPRIVLPAMSSEVTEGSAGETSLAYKDMFRHWELPVYLRSGTLGMREAGTKFLPQEPSEDTTEYNKRLSRTILYGAYSRTIKSLASLPFIDPILVDGIPEELEYIKEDATNEGESLSALGVQLTQDELDYGLSHFLVDHPTMPEGVENLKQERELGLRPYFSRVSPLNLIGWVMVNGVLIQARIYEEVIEKNGDFGEKVVDQVRVIEPDVITLYRLQDGGKSAQGWQIHETIPNTLGKVPLVTVYANKTGQMTAEPLLEELAWLNLKHYQKQSDADNIEHVVNVPILFGSGFGEDETGDFEVKVASLTTTTSENANLRYVEHTGQSIAALHAALATLEKQMIAMGADLLVQKASGRQTATAKVLDDTKSMSVLEAITRALEEGFEKGYKLAGEWLDVDASEADVTIGEGLDLHLDANDIPNLIALHDKGLMEVSVLQAELQRRGKLSDSSDLKEPEKPVAPEVTDDSLTGGEMPPNEDDQGDLENANSSSS